MVRHGGIARRAIAAFGGELAQAAAVQFHRVQTTTASPSPHLYHFAIKMAKWYEWGEGETVITVLTDSMELYGSRLRELTAERGEYTARDAAVSYHQYLMGQDVAYMEELTYPAAKRVHNLKYYTWVEQQGRRIRKFKTSGTRRITGPACTARPMRSMR